LSLLAVLDTDALPSARPWLLNLFYADPDVPFETCRTLDFSSPQACRVIPADPTRAVGTSAPTPARTYPAVLMCAAAVTMLPDACDVEDDDIEFDRHAYWGAIQVLWDAMEGLDGNTAGRHCAVGWPDTFNATPVTRRDADGPAVHLPQLVRDAELGWGWGDAATLSFTIAAKPFAAGDFSAARVSVQSC
jgi:hypothetical protein